MKKVEENRYLLGIVLGIFVSLGVILTNIVFPNNQSDDRYASVILIIYLCFFAYFTFAGFVHSKKNRSFKKGFEAGAITAFISIGLTMLTFILIDNIFLSVVQNQVDKINAFASQTQFKDMRSFINRSNAQGFLVILPIVTILGGMLGIVGVWIRKLMHK